MRILIANASLCAGSDTESYAEDLAVGLRAAGHEAALFAPLVGEQARRLQEAGFIVVEDPAKLPWRPDVIHANQTSPACASALTFPDSPMLVLRHEAAGDEEAVCRAPNVRQYVASSRRALERICSSASISPDSVHLLPDAIDLDRCPRRPPLPYCAARALAFSPEPMARPLVDFLRAVCEEEGIEFVDAARGGDGENPLLKHDIVFATGRSALRAVASGCAVVLVGSHHTGPLVTGRNFPVLRELGFGPLTCNSPHDAAGLRRRLQRYDAVECTAACALARLDGGFTQVVNWLVRTYQRIAADPVRSDAAAMLRFAAQQHCDTGSLPRTPEPVPVILSSQYDEWQASERRGTALLRAERHLIRKIQATIASPKIVQALLRSAKHDLGKRDLDLRESDIAVLSESLGIPLLRPREHAPAPFVVGMPRSGTTRLQLMLNSHPMLDIPTETGFIPRIAQIPAHEPDVRAWFCRTVFGFLETQDQWKGKGLNAAEFLETIQYINPFTIGEGVRCFYRQHAARSKKLRWGDKTPIHVEWMLFIQSILPEARFIHIIRDGRDSVVSLRRQTFAPARDIAGLAAFWVRQVDGGRAQSRFLRHYLEVRFEEMLHAPDVVLRRICRFIDLPFDESMCRLQQHGVSRTADRSAGGPDFSRIGCWKSDFSVEDRRIFEGVAGQLLDELGYEV